MAELPDVDDATQVPQPDSALSRWADALVPDGRLLIQENSALESTHPALGRYYELVAELQRRHGQSLNIGRQLPDLVDRSRYRIMRSSTTPITVRATDMARLHSMNIHTWRHDEAARDFDHAEVQQLTNDLTALAEDPSPATDVSYVMGEMVLARV